MKNIYLIITLIFSYGCAPSPTAAELNDTRTLQVDIIYRNKLYKDESILLSADQISKIQTQIKRATAQPSPGKRGGKIGPDVYIDLIINEQRKTYAILGTSALCDLATGDVWQFYYGAKVLKWVKRYEQKSKPHG